MRGKACVLMVSLAILLLCAPGLSPASTGDAERVRDILDRQCVNLRKDRLFPMLRTGLSAEFDRGLTPELLRIIEGVVKRADFDGVSEEKTYEIIKLVHGAYRRGAPLEYLDQIFDVAYTREVSVEQLFAAANALKEFQDSDVPRDIYEEFVYHTMEERWPPADVPVLTGGLIYGVDRGLTPQRVALAIIVDVDQDGLKKKGAGALVAEAVRMVRDMEPERWRDAGDAQRELLKKEEERKALERLREEAEAARAAHKRLEAHRAEMEARARLEEDRRQRAERERVARELEEARRKSAEMARRYQEEQRESERRAERERKDREAERERKTAEREARRKRELERLEEEAAASGRQAAVDTGRLYAAVDRNLGIPYRFGGDSDTGIDCSAFTRRVYRAVGVELPRTAHEQARVGSGVANESLHPGDLVFFDTSIMGAISHVGVYLDGNTFAHASKSRGVTKSSLRERYYYKR